MRNKVHIILLACVACSSSSQQASNNDGGDGLGSQSGSGGVSSGSLGGGSGSNAVSSGAGVGSSGGASTGSSSGSGGSGASGSGAASGAGSMSGASSGGTGGRGPSDAGTSSGSADSGSVAIGDGSVGHVTGGHDAGASTGCGKSGTGGQVVSINVNGTTRTYVLTVPSDYKGSTPLPVYMAFHGAGQDHRYMMVYNIQDGEVIGIFPDGLTRGSNGTGWDTSANGVDVAMFDAIMASVEQNYCVDQSRIYALGFSFGASMANSLGCFRGDVLRAFASVEGGILFSGGQSACKGPIPGWINEYQMDPTVSFATGQKAEQFFVTLNSDSNPTAYDAPNPCVVYTGNDPLVWCTPVGMVHQWPDYATAAIKRFFGTL